MDNYKKIKEALIFIARCIDSLEYKNVEHLIVKKRFITRSERVAKILK